MTDTDRLAALLHAEFITHEMGKGSADDTCSLCVTRAEHLIAAGVTLAPAEGLREALPSLEDIRRCHKEAFVRWAEAHRDERTGALRFYGPDGPMHEAMRSTMTRLNLLAAALQPKEADRD